MLNLKQERTLNAAVVPPMAAHTNGILGISINDEFKMLVLAATMCSIPYDYFIKAMGKTNLYEDNLGALILIDDDVYTRALVVRIMLLVSLTKAYSQLWEDVYQDFYRSEKWGKTDTRLSDKTFSDLSCTWNRTYSVRNDYSRRELLVEIDVLTAMGLGMTLNQLITISGSVICR